MDKREFSRDLDRLVAAWPDTSMTTVRAEAIFNQVSHVPAAAWRMAVSRLIVEWSRFPNGDRLLAAVDQAWDEQRRDEARSRRGDPTLPSRVDSEAGDQEYGTFRLDLIRQIIHDEVPVAYVPARLEAAAVSGLFPSHRVALLEEARDMRNSPPCRCICKRDYRREGAISRLKQLIAETPGEGASWQRVDAVRRTKRYCEGCWREKPAPQAVSGGEV
jgi:hypothetical protein